MSITLLDGLFVGLVLLSAILAMVRGFSREILSIASWIAAAAAAYLFYQQLAPYLESYVGEGVIANIVAAGIIFIVALIIVTLITMRVADMIIDSRIGPLDRTLGFVFGAVRGIIVAAVAVWFLGFFIGDREVGWIDNAKSKPFLSEVANRLINLLPEDLDAVISGGLEDSTTDN